MINRQNDDVMATASGATDEQKRRTLNLINPKNVTKFGFWNVRTLNITGKDELLVDELNRFNIDIAALSEVRWLGNGEKIIKSTNGKCSYTLFYSGGTLHHYGVAIAIRTQMKSTVTSFSPISDRIAVIEISGLRPVSIISVYAPTDVSTAYDKDKFYNDLQQEVSKIPQNHITIIAGDLNAETGSEPFADITGNFGYGTLNDNGERMITMCGQNQLIAANSWFRHKMHLRHTFESNDGHTKKQNDHILISRRDRSTVEDVKVNHLADILSDHKLVVAKLKLHLKIKRSNKRDPLRNIKVLNQNDVKEQFNLTLSNRFMVLAEINENEVVDIEKSWTEMKNAINETIKETCPKKDTKSKK